MTEDEIRSLIPESYGEIRLDGRHDRRIELRHTTRGLDGEKLAEGAELLARLEMDYGSVRGNLPLDRKMARELIGILHKFITLAELVDLEQRRAQPGAFAEFDKLLGIDSDD